MPGSAGKLATTFREFYENLLAMVREDVPVPVIVERIRRRLPDPEGRKQLLGHLRDSRTAFETEANDEAAETLEQVIKALEKSDVTWEGFA